MNRYLKNSSNFYYILISLIMSLVLGAFLFVLSGYSPLNVYYEIFRGSLGDIGAITNSLSQATPIIFTGLAFVLAASSGIVNIGGEGQLYAGAITAAILGYKIQGLPPVIHIFICLMGAILVGGLCGSLIAFLKIRFGAEEVIVAIMLNYIIQNFTSYLVNNPLKAEGSVGQTELINESAKLPKLIEGYQLSIGILIAIIITILSYYLFKVTKLGYEVKVTGKNYKASKTAGINGEKRILQSMFLSGACAGLGGAIMILGVSHRFIDGFSSGYGFDGIAVAALAGSNILMILISGFFFGALRSGAMYINRVSKIPFDFVIVIQSLVIIFVATPLIAKTLIDKIKRKKDLNVKDGNCYE